MKTGYERKYMDYFENYEFFYDVGDKVMVRHSRDIKPSWDFDVESMEKYCGKEATVIKRETGLSGMKYYKLDIDGGKYYWTNEMLRPPREKEKKEKVTLGTFAKDPEKKNVQEPEKPMTNSPSGYRSWIDAIISDDFEGALKTLYKNLTNRSLLDDDIFTPKIEEGDLVKALYDFLDKAGLGKVEGRFECHIHNDKAKISADLEGNRVLNFEIKGR